MNQLPGLQLVAQAMASSSTDKPSLLADSNNPHTFNQTTADFSALPEGIDPTKLTSSDISALHPLLASLSLSSEDLQAMDEAQIEEIMTQLEAADGVADNLESKLDKLLSDLGGVEKDIIQARIEKPEAQDQHGEGIASIELQT
ncbi:hypothetical protein L204_100354 [Cryptococcus depauperatus]